MGWRWVGWVLALLALALDVLAAASQIYTMFDPAQLVQALAFVPQARAEFVWMALAALGVCLACHAWAAHVLQRRQTGWRALLAALAPLALLNIGPMLAELERPQDNLHLDRRTVVLGSQTDFLHRVFYRSAIGHHLANAGEQGEPGEAHFKAWPHPTAAELAWGQAWQQAKPLPGRMLLLVVESWGVPHQPQELALQMAPLLKAPGLELLAQGQVAFQGGTIAGELREVCSLASSRIDFKTVTPPPGHACWPQRLREQGYATASMNGASALMYNASQWHASAGFERSYFMQTFPGQARRCYSFPSLCDVDLAPFAADTLAASDKSFFYWLSVNSHLPYDARDLRGKVSADCQALGWAADSASCLHHSLVQEFFSALAAAISRPELAGAEVVLVGDHMPPFFQEKDRARFMPGVVPYAHLRVRGALP